MIKKCILNHRGSRLVEKTTPEEVCIADSDAMAHFYSVPSLLRMVYVEKGGEIIPKIKISENIGKITNPHFKKVYRLYDKESGKALADQLCVYDEVIDGSQPLTIFDPEAIWKTKTLTDFTVKELQVPIFKNGECVYESPSIDEIRDYCKEQVDLLWDEVKRFENPHTYYVDLSQKLWDLKTRLLKEQKGK